MVSVPEDRDGIEFAVMIPQQAFWVKKRLHALYAAPNGGDLLILYHRGAGVTREKMHKGGGKSRAVSGTACERGWGVGELKILHKVFL